MNADIINRVSMCVVDATYAMTKRTGVIAKPPAYRAPAVRFRVPSGFNPDEFAEEVRKMLADQVIKVTVKMPPSKRWITVSYTKWKEEYTEAIRAKRRAKGSQNGKEQS